MLEIAQMQQYVIIVEVQGILLLRVPWSLCAATARSQDTLPASAAVNLSATTVENLDIWLRAVLHRKEEFPKRGSATTVIDQGILLLTAPTRRLAIIAASLGIWHETA